MPRAPALYLLFRAGETKAWPATEPPIFASLLIVTVFIPVIVIAGLGNMRVRTLAVWALVAAALCAGLAVHDILRDPLVAARLSWGRRLIPEGPLWPAIGGVLLIVHSLIVAGEADRRPIAGYPRLFDASWKHGVQLALAVAFVAAFWALLYLSAELFRLIGIRDLGDLIQRPWFAAPATTVSFAYALHVTDVRADLVRGVRALALTLLAWLLPMLTAFALAFLAALAIHRAGAAVEHAAGNRHSARRCRCADHADQRRLSGRAGRGRCGPRGALRPHPGRRGRWCRWSRSPDTGWRSGRAGRLDAGAHHRRRRVAAAACYAVGYALAAPRPNLDLKGLEPTNIVAAAVIVVVVLALFSPVADPARIAVADQLRRLEAGQVTPEAFDYKFLRSRSGRYGKEALEQLAARTGGPHAAALSERAKQAMSLQNPVAGRAAGDCGDPCGEHYGHPPAGAGFARRLCPARLGSRDTAETASAGLSHRRG